MIKFSHVTDLVFGPTSIWVKIAPVLNDGGRDILSGLDLI